MKSEIKNCQNCKKDFTIEPDDFGFYEKIKVPPPTWCPECRLIRRLMWRNEHSLFRRPNGASKKSDTLISIYHPDAKIISYDKEMWWSDKWDPCNYGVDYDFSKSFFEQFRELMMKVPHIALTDSKSVNSRFCNMTVEMKNSYLISATWGSEDSMYCNRLWKCKFTHDSYTCFATEFCYENVYCKDSSRLFFSRESEGCLDSYFLYDCRNCSNCIYGFGEFFPPEMSSFAYNETVAQDYFPIDEKIAKKKGYLWREYVPNSYQTTIKGSDLSQTITEVDDSILDQVIECEITKKPFKILAQELNFYRRLNLPLPSIHPDERHNRRLKLRNQMVLRKRMCFFGDKEIDTTYLPESEGGPKKVVCTEHYNQEIY